MTEEKNTTPSLDWINAIGSLGALSVGMYSLFASTKAERAKQEKIDQEISKELEPVNATLIRSTKEKFYSAILATINDADAAVGAVVTRDLENKDQITRAAKLVIDSAWQLLRDCKQLETLLNESVEKLRQKRDQKPPSDSTPETNPEPSEETKPEPPPEHP